MSLFSNVARSSILVSTAALQFKSKAILTGYRFRDLLKYMKLHVASLILVFVDVSYRECRILRGCSVNRTQLLSRLYMFRLMHCHAHQAGMHVRALEQVSNTCHAQHTDKKGMRQ